MWSEGDALGTDGGLSIMRASEHTQGRWKREVNQMDRERLAKYHLVTRSNSD